MNKKIVLAVCFGISTLYLSCNSDDSPSQSSKGLYYFTNLDQYIGFVIPFSPVIKSSNAHSGDCVNIIDTVNRSGLTFSRIKKNISEKKLRSAEVSCWIYADEVNPECYLACSADTAGITVFYWRTINVTKEIKAAKEWTKVSGVFELPDSLPDFVDVRIYPINFSKKPIYVDDISIQFMEK